MPAPTAPSTAKSPFYSGEPLVVAACSRPVFSVPIDGAKKPTAPSSGTPTETLNGKEQGSRGLSRVDEPSIRNGDIALGIYWRDGRGESPIRSRGNSQSGPRQVVGARRACTRHSRRPRAATVTACTRRSRRPPCPRAPAGGFACSRAS